MKRHLSLQVSAIAALAATAQEAGEARLLAGTNYRGDVDAGTELGKAVADKAIARAMADGSDAKFTGTIPTGAGIVRREAPTTCPASLIAEV